MTKCDEVVVSGRRHQGRRAGDDHEFTLSNVRMCWEMHRASKPLARRARRLAAVKYSTRLSELFSAQYGSSLYYKTILELAHDAGGAAATGGSAVEYRSAQATSDVPTNPPKRIYVGVDGIMFCTNQTKADPDHPGKKRRSTA